MCKVTNSTVVSGASLTISKLSKTTTAQFALIIMAANHLIATSTTVIIHDADNNFLQSGLLAKEVYKYTNFNSVKMTHDGSGKISYSGAMVRYICGNSFFTSCTYTLAETDAYHGGFIGFTKGNVTCVDVTGSLTNHVAANYNAFICEATINDDDKHTITNCVITLMAVYEASNSFYSVLTCDGDK